MSEEFQKFDKGKPPLAILFDMPKALMHTANILGHGVDKYGRMNFKKMDPVDVERYLSAALRHIMAHCSGEYIDGDSGDVKSPHLANAIADLLIVLEYEEGLTRDVEPEEEGPKCCDSTIDGAYETSGLSRLHEGYREVLARLDKGNPSLLKFLDVRDRLSKYINNILLSTAGYDEGDECIMSQAFSWEKTPEGYDFWSTLEGEFTDERN